MSKPFVTSGRIDKGKFAVRNRPQIERWASLERDGDYTVTIERLVASRSPEQSALYFVAFVKPLAEYTGYTMQEMHTYLKQRFLPAQKRKAKTMTLVNRRTGEIIDEYELDLSSTTTLNKIEMSDYMRDIGIWAAETFGLELGSNRERLSA